MGRPVELKAESPSGVKLGKRQLGRYLRDFDKGAHDDGELWLWRQEADGSISIRQSHQGHDITGRKYPVYRPVPSVGTIIHLSTGPLGKTAI